MVDKQYSIRVRLLAIVTVISMLLSLIPAMNSPKDVEAATTTYKFTSSLISGGGDLSTRFKITRDGRSLTGLCRHGGPLNSASGRATMKKLSRDDDRFYLANYYGRVKGWTSGANGCDLARAFNYATYGNAYHQSASRSKEMIKNAKNYAKDHPVPSNFVAYDCNPTDGSQEFIAWYYAPSGSLTITKKSTNTDVLKTGAYTFKGIQYKVYEKKSTSSTCVGTLTCKADGTTGKITLRPNGLDAKTYYIKEYATNSSYKKSDTWYSVSISPGENAKLTVKDTPQRGSLTFYKAMTSKSEPGSSVQGFKFTLTNKNSSKISYTATSDANGKVTFSNIPLGTYTLRETLSLTQLKKKYKMITSTQTVTIKAGANKLSTSGNKFYNERVLDDPGLAVQKNTDDGGPVEGWTFDVKDSSGNVVATLVTNENGYAQKDNLPAGTYTVTEKMSTSQSARYRQPVSQTVTLVNGSTEDVVAVFDNTSITEEVKIKKVSDDGNISDIGFTITGTKYPGTEYESDIEPIVGSTEDDGYFDIGELAPGDYVVEETSFEGEYYKNEYPLSGYDNPAREFSVVDGGIVIDGETVTTGEIEFKNTPYRILLEKTKILADGTKTDEPLSDAEYQLYEVVGGSESFVGSYVTDENGKIDITGISPGDYRFYETSPPSGYIVKEETTGTGENAVTRPVPIDFTLDSSGSGTVTVKDTNQQKYGFIFIKKFDTSENPVEDAEFTLFTDEACTTIAKDKDGNDIVKLSDSKGYVKIEDIKWGTYYLKETKAPRGYELLDEVKKIVVGYDAEADATVTDYELEYVNEQQKGGVELTKVDEDGNIISNPAVYDLYKDDGTLVKEDLTTGADNDGNGSSDGVGKISVVGLEWGKYYFLEKEAPTGYSVSSEKIRFTINSLVGGKVQKVQATDKVLRSYVVATKKIKADDIWWDHGTPTFMFNLKSTDGSLSFNRSVTFSEEYVNAHTDSEGYVSLSATFTDLPVGEYILSEGDVVRYKFKEIEKSSVLNGTVNGETVVFDLVDSTTYGAATFVNDKDEWQELSDTPIVANMLKKGRIYSALSAEYTGGVLDGNMPIDDIGDYLIVDAVYDDGTSKRLDSPEYVVTDSDGNVFNRTPKVAGTYTLFVSYTEGNTTHTDTVEIEVAGVKRLTVNFNAMGGTLEDTEIKVWAYDTLAESTSDVSKYTPTKIGYSFGGWYAGYSEEDGYSELFDVNSTRVVSDMTLYAKWIKLSPILVTGSTFYSMIPTDAYSIVFTDEVGPDSAIDLSEAGNGSVVGWLDDTTWKVSTQVSGFKAIANPDSSYMFGDDSGSGKSGSIGLIDATLLDTSLVTDMSYMFKSVGFLCPGNGASLKLVGLDDWNTSNVRNMSGMFMNMTASIPQGFPAGVDFSIGDLSKWDVSNVTDMSFMFSTCGFRAANWSPGDLSNWNTSKVTNMSSMFTNAGGRASTFDVGDIGKWDVSNVTNMYYMFFNAGYVSTSVNVGDIGKWDVSKVTNMCNMFSYFGKYSGVLDLLDLSNWNTLSVTNMYKMFSYTDIKEIDMSNWNTSSVTNMDDMFYSCDNLAKVTVGDKFKWVGSDYLPTPSSTYIPGADGNWYNTSGVGYAVGSLPDNVADTYYAINYAQRIADLEAEVASLQSQISANGTKIYNLESNEDNFLTQSNIKTVAYTNSVSGVAGGDYGTLSHAYDEFDFTKPLGVVGYRYVNSADSGANSSYQSPYGEYLSSTGYATAKARNLSSNTAVFTLYHYVLGIYK